MARSDLVISLVKAGLKGNASAVRTIAESIAADERAKKHTGVADRIHHALRTTNQRASLGERRVSLRNRDAAGGIMRKEPRRSLGELFLSPCVLNACAEFVDEQRRADVLRAHGLEPRHRVLLSGPPGNGKTSLAEALAFELALPLFVVRYDAVVTSYLGETAQRLRRLFDLVRTEPCVLFFDEFDAIGKERGDIHETGEIKRVVTTLLMQLDELPSYCVLLAATNHPELLDRATWRRFEVRLELTAPTTTLLNAYFSERLDRLPGQTGYTPQRLCEAVSPASFAEAEDFFLDVERAIALAHDTRTLRSIIEQRVKTFAVRRYRPEQQV